MYMATPPVGGERFLMRYRGPVMLTIGATAAAALTGVFVFAIGLAARPWSQPIIAIVGFGGIGCAVFGTLGAWPRPFGGQWQVPRHWRLIGFSSFSLVFGAMLGPGMLTKISTWSYWSLMVFAALQTHVFLAVALLVSYALGRAGMIWLGAVHVHRSEDWRNAQIEFAKRIGSTAGAAAVVRRVLWSACVLLYLSS